MDISAIKATSRTFELLHPATDEKVGIRWTLLPDSDPKIKKLQREFQNRQFEKRKMKLSAEQLEANTLETLIAATESWEWYGEEISFQGEKPEFSEANVRKVLKTVDWIKDQVKDEFNEREAFFEG